MVKLEGQSMMLEQQKDMLENIDPYVINALKEANRAIEAHNK